MYRGSWRVAGLAGSDQRPARRSRSSPSLGASLVQVLVERLSAVALRHLRRGQPAPDHRRSAPRTSFCQSTMQRSSHQGVPVLIYGAGRARRGRRAGALSELGRRPAADRVHRRRLADAREARERAAGVRHRAGARADHRRRRAHARSSWRRRTFPTERLERAAQVCKASGVSLFRLDVTVERLERRR